MEKKLVGIVLSMVMFLMVGCAAGQVQIDQDSQEVIAKITGRRAGFELVKSHPDIAKEVSVVCQEIISQSKPDLVIVAVNSLIAILGAEIDDPLLVADIKDIVSLIKFEYGLEISVEQLAVVKAVAEGLSAGIEIGGRK